jgi:DNA (cytosine-5)-methyltransferase 1
MPNWAYYNDIDPFCCEWVKNLIKAGVIMDGEVDGRSIKDVTPDDLMGFERVHMFCGIAGWEHALNLAGWRGEVWTGSCPCQSFSTAGRGKGFTDERHLWPYWFHLIRECRPATIFGEQVASKAALSWFDLVQDDLEGEGYAVGSADLCAASVGAFHIRQRLWFVAHADSKRCYGQHPLLRKKSEDIIKTARSSTSNFWSSAVWLPCRDGRHRPALANFHPLVDGLSFKLGSGSPLEGKSRVGMLKGAGNAIVPQIAEVFIRAASI